MQECTEIVKDLVSDENSIFNPKAANEKRGRMIKEFRMPQWVLANGTRKCPECGELLTETSVREVGLCLNAQNIGDIQVEILCNNCNSGYYLYFRKACRNFCEFSQMVCSCNKTPFSPIGEPIQHTKMHANENNLADAIVEEYKGKGETCQ